MRCSRALAWKTESIGNAINTCRWRGNDTGLRTETCLILNLGLSWVIVYKLFTTLSFSCYWFIRYMNICIFIYYRKILGY